MIYEWTCPACGNVVRAAFMRVGATITCPGCGQQQLVKDDALLRKPEASADDPRLTPSDLASLGDSSAAEAPSLPMEMDAEEEQLELADQHDPNQETVIEPLLNDTLPDDATELSGAAADEKGIQDLSSQVIHKSSGGISSKVWLSITGVAVGILLLLMGLRWWPSASSSQPNASSAGGPVAPASGQLPAVTPPNPLAKNAAETSAPSAVDAALARQTQVRFVPLAHWSKKPGADETGMTDPDVVAELTAMDQNVVSDAANRKLAVSLRLADTVVDANVRIVLLDAKQRVLARLDEPVLLLHASMPQERMVLVPPDLLAQVERLELLPVIRDIQDAPGKAMAVDVQAQSTPQGWELALSLVGPSSQTCASLRFLVQAFDARDQLKGQWDIFWPHELKPRQSLRAYAQLGRQASLPADSSQPIRWKAYALSVPKRQARAGDSPEGPMGGAIGGGGR